MKFNHDDREDGGAETTLLCRRVLSQRTWGRGSQPILAPICFSVTIGPEREVELDPPPPQAIGQIWKANPPRRLRAAPASLGSVSHHDRRAPGANTGATPPWTKGQIDLINPTPRPYPWPIGATQPLLQSFGGPPFGPRLLDCLCISRV